MKKIYLILALMVLLFAAAFVVYNTQLAQEEAVIDTGSSLNSDAQEKSEEDSDSTSSVAVSITQPVSTSGQVTQDDTQDETSSEADESLEVAGWQGPESNYLNAEGDLLHLSDNYGKGTLINIWASWCEPCRVEMPYFEEAYQTYGDQINLIMLDALGSKPSETQEAAEAFFEEMGLSMPLYFDHEMNNQYLFGATILPLTVILDEEGKVVEIVRGQVSPAKLQQIIEKIL